MDDRVCGRERESLSLRPLVTLSHTLSLSHTHSLTLYLSHTHSLPLWLSHICTHSPPLSHSHTHTHTHSLPPSLILTLARFLTHSLPPSLTKGPVLFHNCILPSTRPAAISLPSLLNAHVETADFRPCLSRPFSTCSCFSV